MRSRAAHNRIRAATCGTGTISLLSATVAHLVGGGGTHEVVGRQMVGARMSTRENVTGVRSATQAQRRVVGVRALDVYGMRLYCGLAWEKLTPSVQCSRVHTFEEE